MNICDRDPYLRKENQQEILMSQKVNKIDYNLNLFQKAEKQNDTKPNNIILYSHRADTENQQVSLMSQN